MSVTLLLLRSVLVADIVAQKGGGKAAMRNRGRGKGGRGGGGSRGNHNQGGDMGGDGSKAAFS